MTGYYNKADEYYLKKEYENALLYIEKALYVEGIDHIPEAVEKKKEAVALKIKIESGQNHERIIKLPGT